MHDLHQFEPYAASLARRYRLYGSAGAGADDVTQEAMIAAWQAIRVYQPRPGSDLVPFVRQRMRWRVIDYVRVGNQQGLAEREATAIEEWPAVGRDSTVQTVIARDELAHLATEMRQLTPGQAVAMRGRLNGLTASEIAAGRRPGTIAAQTHLARRRLAAAIAA